MQRIQHQIFNTGRPFCDFEVFLVKELVTIKIERYQLWKLCYAKTFYSNKETFYMGLIRVT